jgi:hypothetical protein
VTGGPAPEGPETRNRRPWSRVFLREYDLVVHEPQRRKAPRVVDALLCLAGVAGIAAGITLLALDGRALMDIGGFCAEGGPYVIQTHCPHNSDIIFLLGFLGGGAAILLAAWKSSAIGVGGGTVFLLAFAAAFGVIGLESILGGFDPPGDEPGWAWGWLIMGFVFVTAALVPLVLVALSARLLSPGLDTAGGTPGEAHAGAHDLSRESAAGAGLIADAGEAGPGGPGRDLVEGLERLARLRDRGLLTDDEYTRAKEELLGRGDGGDAGGAAAGGGR